MAVSLEHKNPTLWARLNRVLSIFPRAVPDAAHVLPTFSLRINDRKLLSTGESKLFGGPKIPAAGLKPLSAFLTPSILQGCLTGHPSVASAIVEQTGPLLNSSDQLNRIEQRFSRSDVMSSEVFAPMRTALGSSAVGRRWLSKIRALEISFEYPATFFYMPFGSLPLSKHLDAELSPVQLIALLFALSNFAWKRSLLSLTKICAIHSEPAVFFDNGKLAAALKRSPHLLGSFFYSALRIDPCLLQTQLGTEILKSISFWDPENARNLGIALNPKLKKARIREEYGSKNSEHTVLIKQALLLLLAHEPGTKAASDRDLIRLLSKNRYCSPSISEEVFRKTREKVFKHRPTKRIV